MGDIADTEGMTRRRWAGIASASLAAVAAAAAVVLGSPATGQGFSLTGRCVAGRPAIEVTIPSGGGRVTVDGTGVFSAGASGSRRSLTIAHVGGRTLTSGTHTVAVGSSAADVTVPAC